MFKKGEVYERISFTAKNKLFKQEHYLDEAKRFYTDLINLLIKKKRTGRTLHRFIGAEIKGRDDRPLP